MDLKLTNENRLFANAFIKVAKILEPRAKFTAITINHTINGGNLEVSHVVSGRITDGDTNLIVEVSTERHPSKGQQIVIKYYDYENSELQDYMTRSVWFYTFNWVGLIHETKCDEKIL